MTTPAVPSLTPAVRDTGMGRVLEIVSPLVIVMTLWTSWRRFPAVWTNDRSHGYVIAALCLWLIWRDRAALRRLDAPVPGASLLLLGVSLLWMMAVALSAQVVHLALAPAILIAWLLVVRGFRATSHALQIGAAFTLAVPMWEVLTGPLQTLTVWANSVLVFITRIPARVDGTMIHLNAGILQVAYSCAGINFLMSGLTLGACYAFLFTISWRTRLRIVLAAGAVSVLSNWVRVFGLIVIGHVTDMRSSLMRDHVVYGWIVFAAFLPLFFFLARRIELREAATGGVSVTALPLREARPAMSRVLPATAIATCGPLVYLLLAFTQQAPGHAGTAPGVFVAGADTAQPRPAWQPGFTGAERHLVGVADVAGRTVQVDRLLYGTQHQGTEMIGGDNRLAVDSVIAGASVFGPLDEQLRTVREVLLRTADGNGRLAWYWYHVAGVTTPSANRAKLLEFWAFLRRSPSSEIVVLSTPCLARDCRPARQTLFKAATGRDMPVATKP